MVAFYELDEVAYADAERMQHALRDAVLAGSHPGGVLLLTHPPTITLGRHAKPEHVLLSTEALRARGCTLEATDRGGDVTWHGPGQLVGYPVLPIARMGLGVRTFVERLAEALARVLASLGITAEWRQDTPGLFVDGRKITAFGLRVHHGVTTHGFALNVAPDLSWYAHLVPCGLVGVGVTSIEREVGLAPAWPGLRAALIDALCDVLHLQHTPDDAPWEAHDAFLRAGPGSG